MESAATSSISSGGGAKKYLEDKDTDTVPQLRFKYLEDKGSGR